jgi:hypothetical protein
MVNEVIQWVALAVLAFFLLGVFRQVSVGLPPEGRAVPSGPRLGSRIPKQLMHVLTEELSSGGNSLVFVAFVTESCIGCQQLLSHLDQALTALNGHRLILVAKNASPQFREALGETHVRTVEDNGDIWSACGVTATPLILKLDANGRVLAKEVTHRVDILVEETNAA